MPGRITPDAAGEALRPWLGAGFLARADGLPRLCAGALNDCRPPRYDFAKTAGELDNALFLAVRDDTRGRMALVMDDGRLIRLRMQDFTTMADELLWLRFSGMPVTEENRALIAAYSMKAVSLSALRALYLLYRDLQTPEETNTIRRVVTGCHEPFRFRAWIDT